MWRSSKAEASRPVPDAGSGIGVEQRPRLKVITPALRCRDLESTIAFYTEWLGFVVESMWPADEPTFCILDNGPVHLMFHTEAYEGASEAPLMTGQLHIDMEGGVLALHERLEDEVEVLWGPEVYSYGRREFSIRDPNGYRLIFGAQK